MSGIAGGSDKFSAGVSGLVKKRLDCTVAEKLLSFILSSHGKHLSFRPR